MKVLTMLCLAVCFSLSAFAQSTPPTIPSRTNLSQAERDPVTAKRTLDDHIQAKSKETKSNKYNVNLDSDRQTVRAAESRVMYQQKYYDQAMDKYNRDMQAYLREQAKKQQSKK
jgi:hypothetical protein